MPEETPAPSHNYIPGSYDEQGILDELLAKMSAGDRRWLIW